MSTKEHRRVGPYAWRVTSACFSQIVIVTAPICHQGLSFRCFEPLSPVSNEVSFGGAAKRLRKHTNRRQRQGAEFGSEGHQRPAERPKFAIQRPQPHTNAVKAADC